MTAPAITETQARLDTLCPWRTRVVPVPDQTCESCGHLPGTCDDDCCWLAALGGGEGER